MSIHQSLREQIDACRPGSNDLALPGLAELAQSALHDRAVADELAHSHRIDQMVACALHDVAVPAGLAERILERAALAEQKVNLPDKGASESEPTCRGVRWTRRHWLLVGGSLGSVAVAALVIVSLVLRSPRQVTQAELGNEVNAWLPPRAPKSWLPAASLPKGLIDRAVVPPPRQWQQIVASKRSAWSANVVAIDLAPPGGPQAFLFVVRSSANFAVPARPITTMGLTITGGFQATAWQRPGSKLLYVLVVRDARIEDYLKPTSEA